jgi:dCMP deaminase
VRPTREEALFSTAYIWASRSTCDRLHVGCVIERDGRILVQGYNGAPAGLSHCNHDCNCNTEGYPYQLQDDRGEKSTVHRSGCRAPNPCTRAVHAEQNAISFAARWGVELKNSSAWVTHQPCMSCSQSLINAGIIEVNYVEPYRLQDGLDLLREAGIKVTRRVDFPVPK